MLHDFCDCTADGTERLKALMFERRGFQFLEAARRHGRGTLLITGHLGAWELEEWRLPPTGSP